MEITAEKYRELFKMRATGALDNMVCTENLYKIIRDYYFEGMSILDIPCGTGHYYRKLKELGYFNYYGVDLDSKAIDIAKEIWTNNDNVHFSNGDICNLVFDDNYFDISFCYNLILHIPSYEKAIKELIRVSKKYIIIRSLFSEKTVKNEIKAPNDYLDVYPEGFFNYNTYSRQEISEFIKKQCDCEIKFIKDNVIIPNDELKKQSNILKVSEKEFASNKDKKEVWKGIDLNYEILIIEKK